MVDVQRTGVLTFIRDNGQATVNVGNAGSVQGIQGAVYVLAPAGNNIFNIDENTINIDDSADAVPRTATLHTFAPAGAMSRGWRRRDRLQLRRHQQPAPHDQRVGRHD